MANPSGLAQTVLARFGPKLEIVPTGGFALAVLETARTAVNSVIRCESDRDVIWSEPPVEVDPVGRTTGPTAQVRSIQTIADGSAKSETSGEEKWTSGHSRRCRNCSQRIGDVTACRAVRRATAFAWASWPAVSPATVEDAPHEEVSGARFRWRLPCTVRGRMNRRIGVALLLVLCAGVGCGGSDGDPGPAPADLEVAGAYEVVSTYDLTAAGLLPEPVAGYAQAVSGLGTNPARTLFLLLDQAGVPLASDLMAALPGPVSNQLESWINEFIASRQYGNASVKSELDALAAAIQTVVARPDVVSRLQIDPPG